MTGVDDRGDNWRQVFRIIDLEVVVVTLIDHLWINHGCRLWLLGSLGGRHGDCEVPSLFLPKIILLEGVKLLLLLILHSKHH